MKDATPVLIDPTLFDRPGRILLTEAPDGLVWQLAAEFAAGRPKRDLVLVMRDDARMAAAADALKVHLPEAEVLRLPAWDCLPYDRASPNGMIAAERMDTLTRLAGGPATDDPKAGTGSRPRAIVVTTVNALAQRVPPRESLALARLRLEPGHRLSTERLVDYLMHNGYVRAGTVMEPGEFAVRGGIVDLFPAGEPDPVRLDFFGDEVEAIRNFDPVTQRSNARIRRLDLKPVSEILLTEGVIQRFRQGYRQAFGAVGTGDPLYEAISAGRRHAGMEHWLPLFHTHLEPVTAYFDRPVMVFDHLADQAFTERRVLIEDYYEARRTGPVSIIGGEREAPYRALPPDQLYLTAKEWAEIGRSETLVVVQPGAAERPLEQGWQAARLAGRAARDFAPERKDEDVNLFEALKAHVDAERSAGRRVVVCCYSAGSLDRIRTVFEDHGLKQLEQVETWADIAKAKPGALVLIVLPLDHGYVAGDLSVLTEQDILGDRLHRKTRRKRRAENFLRDADSLTVGDLVVHVDHGIGRYEGLETITAGGAPHDCVLVVYEGGDRLFVPVEHIDMLSRYGAADGPAPLDRLGGSQWQQRKERTKRRLKDMADALIAVAAERQLKGAARIERPQGLYDEFCARFPYTETEDQLHAIEDVIDDLASGRPMDRLICGDVGFGKTEVALRAAFIAAMSGVQVAVVAPTTLLCHQHFLGFTKRFQGFPIKIVEVSRLVAGKRATEAKKAIADGTADIVIGTHALLSKGISFRDLGLMIIDEEQHFGVKHKERLKELKADVHVLTLTATPIPRTLQLALAGVKELSIIATPPVDRLALRTFTMPYDSVIVREAILREHYRGGQTFFVCPRIEQVKEVEERLRSLVPEVKIAVAHGRLAAGELEDVMGGFYGGEYDVLLSTSIVESGLDIPRANTIIIYRADLFGLAQLYQLRGRVGRGKLRGYAYLMLPANHGVTRTAEKRLDVMQTLDSLGAGFTLASHDLDIRGAGNLLGEEQSGHIREVGLELFQQMLDDAIEAAKTGGGDAPARAPVRDWSPQINLGAAVLIPETYVSDLDVRMSLYRRLADLDEGDELDAFAAELVDRFGPLPDEVRQLLQIVAIKRLCIAAGVEKVEAGPKGATIAFHLDQFARPDGLIQFIAGQSGTIRLRPDHKLVVIRAWATVDDRLKGARDLIATLARIARTGKAA
ncbi:transcription-repair coupling factor [Tistrella mobilis]|uniref:transcription-repair coupling factor n=1 Tax=Tistrella mobilis TaxID=171437 RepID=UPI0035592611